MEERQIEELVDRIGAALARIERSVARGERDLRDLSQRHDGLKLSVTEALRDVDALIAKASE